MAAEDRFASYVMDMTGSITRDQAVIPNDESDLEFVSRAIWTDSGGQVRVLLKESTDPSTYLLPPGVWVSMRVQKVFDTGTVAQGIKVGD